MAGSSFSLPFRSRLVFSYPPGGGFLLRLESAPVVCFLGVTAIPVSGHVAIRNAGILAVAIRPGSGLCRPIIPRRCYHVVTILSREIGGKNSESGRFLNRTRMLTGKHRERSAGQYLRRRRSLLRLYGYGGGATGGLARAVIHLHREGVISGRRTRGAPTRVRAAAVHLSAGGCPRVCQWMPIGVRRCDGGLHQVARAFHH